MQPVKLVITDIDILNTVHTKLKKNIPLNSDEWHCLDQLFNSLPSTAMILSEHLRFDEEIKTETIHFKEIQSDIEQWLSLFNSLPKMGDKQYPMALPCDPEEDPFFWKRQVIIEVSFVPSYLADKEKYNADKVICLMLKIDGTASFRFSSLRLVEWHKELYLFTGSWREAYLLVVQTLKDGWPRTVFPPEFEPLLKK